MELYAWQRKCLKKWEENHYRGIVNVITGAGKTILSISAISLLNEKLSAEHRNLRVRIVVPTTWLAHQWKMTLEEKLPEASSDEGIGLFGGSRRDAPRRFCTIYVVNSARYSITRHITEDIKEGYEVLLIADECHHYGSPENRKIFDYQKYPVNCAAPVYTLGLSATPDCAEYESVLKPALGEEIYHYGFEAAVKESTVSSYRIGQISLSFSAWELAEYDELSSRLSVLRKKLTEEYPFLREMGAIDFFKTVRHLASEEEELPSQYLKLSYQRAGISQNASARILCGVSLIRLLDPQQKILVFCERISQAEDLYDHLRSSMQGNVVRYHSGLTRELRRISLEKFRVGEARILISCRALDEGMDVPSVGVGIVMSCCAQSRQRIQRLGRILRKSAEKDSAVLYYLHVRESAEDSAYLPDRVDPSRIFFLEYFSGEDSFLNHSYEALAADLWAEGMNLFPDDGDKLEELRFCLQQGLVRPDWMETAAYCDEKLLHAKNRHERNYWICMKRISALADRVRR